MFSRIACFMGFLSLAGLMSAPAGTAAFSQDGKRVYLVMTSNEVTEISVPDGKTRTLPIRCAGLGDTLDAAVAVSNSGFLLLAGSGGLGAWDPRAGLWTRVCPAPEGERLVEVACHPVTGDIAVTTLATQDNAPGETRAYIIQKGTTRLRPCVLRRAGHLRGLTFDAAGNAYFTQNGDVWKGEIAVDEGASQGDDVRYALTAERIHPLGRLECANATSNSYGAIEVAPLGKELLVRVSRLGGSGSTRFVRIPNENLYETQGPLKSVPVLENGGARGFLAADPAGTQAWGAGGDLAFWWDAASAKRADLAWPPANR